jgi:uncharacterized protein (DUF2249 family)
MTDTMTNDPVRLDVRPIIGAGDEPFETIIAAADTIAEGGILELTAPFQPSPLYPVLRKRGFSAETEQRAPDEWVVRFKQTGINTETLLAAAAERHPATVKILAKYGFDLCCGGAKPIEVAARAHGVDLDTLLRELQALVG